MSKEEFLKIQTCVLKVNIHCDGCKQKVKKILQKIDGVYTTNIDSEQGKVTVSGNVDPATLIKKLTKNGKHAEIWGASKANNNNQNQMNNQLKNLQIDNGSKGGKNKGQTPKGGGNNQPQGGLQAQNPQFQQLQQMLQSKGLQDLKIPPQFMKDPKGANNNKDQNQKSVKFNMPEDEEFSDDDFDDEFDDDDDDDDFEDELDDIPVINNKMKPPVLANGHGGAQMGNIMMNNIMNGQHLPMMKGNANNGGNGGGNGQKGGGGNMPVQMNLGGGNQNQGGAGGGKKGGNGNNNGGNQNQGGGKGGKNGGGQPNDGKNGGGGQNKNGGGAGGGGGGALNGNNSMGNGAKKGGGMNDGPHGMPNMMMPMSGGGGHMGPLGANMPMGQMGHLPMGQMNNLAAVQGLPASAMTGGGGGGGGAGYFPAPTPEQMTANTYHQQQLAAMMMNQQRANGNERFQPMMYARPPPAVNYMPPYPTYPYSYPYAPPHGERIDQYTMFSDENTSSCNVM